MRSNWDQSLGLNYWLKSIRKTPGTPGGRNPKKEEGRGGGLRPTATASGGRRRTDPSLFTRFFFLKWTFTQFGPPHSDRRPFCGMFTFPEMNAERER